MLNIFKSKEERAKIKEEKEASSKQALQVKIDFLKEKWKDEIKSYCKINGEIFILTGFVISDGQVCVAFQTVDCPEEYCEILSIQRWELKYGHSDFKLARVNFIRFKESLKTIGLQLVKIEKQNHDNK
jgi:hypothetical protein